MNKAQLIDLLAQRMDGDKRAASAAVEGVVDIVVRTVQAGENVTITGFGVFERRGRAARVARNPRTGETVHVAPTSVPSFRPGTTFKAVVSGAAELPADAPAVKRTTSRTRATVATTPAKRAATKTAVTKTAVTKTAVTKTAATKTAATKTAATKTAATKTAATKTAAKRAAPARVAATTSAPKTAAAKTAAKAAAASAPPKPPKVEKPAKGKKVDDKKKKVKPKK